MDKLDGRGKGKERESGRAAGTGTGSSRVVPELSARRKLQAIDIS